MAHEPETLLQWNDLIGKKGKEFKLPDISSPWLAEIFEFRKDILDWAEVPTAHVDSLQALKVVRKEFSLTRIADISFVQSHFESSLELKQGEFYIPDPVEKYSSSESSLETTKGLCSGRAAFLVDRPLMDEAFARTDGGNWHSFGYAVQGHLSDYEEDLNAEGYGENEIEE